ncbi:hypothetical protein Syun_023012 [Stephania yunnanensis]|uniref:Receptor-like serine/threonine-protein kinase n=1 Tax=Stephania yunnanensis TaxID=152371 RepID=A0AAP0F859_9MAGN
MIDYSSSILSHLHIFMKDAKIINVLQKPIRIIDIYSLADVRLIDRLYFQVVVAMLSSTKSALFALLLITTSLPTSSAATTDVITQGQVLNYTQTLVSSGGDFELGFFAPGSPNSFYVGIWYKKISIRTVVWVANRDRPTITSAANSSCALTINLDGNLVIVDASGVFVNISSIAPGRRTSAKLLDSSNLELRDSNTGELLWESFDYLTDTFLPGMKIGFDLTTGKIWNLTAWKSPQDPSPGEYHDVLDPNGSTEFLLLHRSEKYWTSGPWTGEVFLYVPEIKTNGVYNFSFFTNKTQSYFFYTTLNNSPILSRFVLDVSGKLQTYSWVENVQKWVLFWEQPRQQCDLYNYCSAYSDCDQTQFPYCNCLMGFRPSSDSEWGVRNWTSGCVRNTALGCGNKDGFILMSNVSLPIDPKTLIVQSADECRSACLNSCSCSGYSYSDRCWVWFNSLYNVRKGDVVGGDLYLRLADSDVKVYQDAINNNSPSSDSGNKSKLALAVALPTGLSVLCISTIAGCFIWRRKRKQGNSDTSQDLLQFDFSTKPTSNKNEPSHINNNSTGGIWDADLPLFSLASVSAATYNFSSANELGQGGFGHVYKGTLLNGQEVAVKRLSRDSGQGLEELKNEMMLIAKLQHRNLVRLLGCCIEGDEKTLIYEYMPNKSLDLILFDSKSKNKLSWEKRVIIIEGIAQGLLYLHQYSRLRIIHRDLKASNILLDSEMNPKISDFGMARIFGGNVSEANTNRVVGTYGYMAPEYAMNGLFSIKSDVFSFGVLLLEILSGRKNSSFYTFDNEDLNLIGHAWILWTSERGLDFFDTSLGDLSCLWMPLRYIHVALLCLQEKPNDRPTMSEVIAMLSNEVIYLSSPKQPAFSTLSSVDTSSIISKNASSTNEVTITLTPR